MNEDNLIAVTLTPAYDTKAAEDHAVYVQVTDASNVLATNTFCFMVNKSPSKANFCRSFCLDIQISQVKTSRPEYLEYVVASSGSSTAVTYTD